MKRFFILGCLFCSLYADNQEAVCVVPVADLTGGNLATIEDEDIVALYHQLPLNGPATQVKRIDQLLFNEQVQILKTKGQECRISVPTHAYSAPTNSTLHHEYWTLAKNIAPLNMLDNSQAIPDQDNNSNTITLVQPFYDNKHHQLYSAGTRFKLDIAQDDDGYYRVLLLSPQLKTGHLYIPKDICLQTSLLNNQEKIDRFIAILNSLAQQPRGYVPYVFGGNSFIKPYTNKTINQEENGSLTVAYPTKTSTHSGFDCASLVHFAAQTAGIPFFYKNSSAIKHHLKPLKEHEPVENGDIIHIPGHIIVLVDKDTNTTIEARTQTHGYGYVHRIPLAQLFKEIPNTEKLIEYHYSKKLVSRLNAQGDVISRLPVTIFKIKSVFDSTTPAVQDS